MTAERTQGQGSVAQSLLAPPWFSPPTLAPPTQSVSCVAPPRWHCLLRSCWLRRKEAREGGAPRGRLRLRSTPGGFLVLGVAVVLVGGAVAVAGYWPQRSPRTALIGQGIGAGALGPGRGHSERMKLIGPIVMGVGLFIFICANTLLYENRDHETQRLLAQERAAIRAMATAQDPPLPRANAQSPRQAQPAFADLNIRCLGEGSGLEWAGSEAMLLQEGGGATLLTEALHHQESSSGSTSQRSLPSGSCDSSEVNFNILTGSPLLGPHPAPLIKLYNCPPPRRSYSLSSRADPRHPAPTATPLSLRKDFSSNLCQSLGGGLNAPPGERKHRSWPRLNRGGGRRYLKLENKEDSVDRLLEQQDSQWGSGPFQ